MKLFYRRTILILADAFFIISSISLSLFLSGNKELILSSGTISIYSITTIIGISIYGITGQYKGITRYVGSSNLYKIALRNLILICIILYIESTYNLISTENKSIFILIWLLINFFSGASRFFLRDLILLIKKSLIKEKENVIIYGAGDTGIQLAASLRISKKYNIICFIDKDPNLWDRNLNGIKIKPKNYLNKLIYTADRVLLAIPSLKKAERRKIVEEIGALGLPILQIPLLEEIALGSNIYEQLRPISIEDILGRDPVPPNKKLFGPGIKNKNICITGAGGSIGSEICRQLMKLNPKKIILIDNSEFNLYKIDYELKKSCINNIQIISILGSTSDYEFIKNIFNKHSINIIFHSSAYKHVELVEKNPINGLKNNIFSTYYLCKAAQIFSVEKFVLISSDKAVRPTNIMGASKRFSEIICKAFDKSSNKKCLYSMVRFGNVLGSSGSVFPLFKKQIAEREAITITDKKVIRYFMTIEEASQLVIQTSVLSKGGDIFLLDMGHPVSIYDLAINMIHLSGLTIKNEKNPNGDIEIKIIGLKSGEKLYEELLINKKSIPTIHPRIFEADEPFNFSEEYIHNTFEKLEICLNSFQKNKTFEIIKEIVPEWEINTGV